MWEKLRVVFTIPELRQKIFLTLIFLGIYRVGFQITLPIIDQNAMASTTTQSTFGDFVDKVAVFAASDLQKATIFGLGIMPYISASIIFQLLGSVWKPLEELRKEGETGRKKINEYTRYVTVLLCFVQSWFYLWAIMQPRSGVGMIAEQFLSDPGDPTSLSFGWQLTAVVTMTCGTIFLMWLGEQIDEFGIGNGISLLIMAGILARMPGAMINLIKNAEFELLGFGSSRTGIETLIVLCFLFVAVVFGVVFITLGQRRIPTQSAKHVRGRRVYGGTRQHLPLRINQAGVMPIIFASSLLMLPTMIFGALAGVTTGRLQDVFGQLGQMLGGGLSFTYNLLYVVLIYFFCYFWTAITFNPKEMSENLKDYGTFIPGYRPGKRTAEYLEKVMVR
ncbi:MAG: preprotein translocase subunit SecY, partial [Planctomycetia bacterium]|nr:preprotein translocase subunit SecY [Planctomycetia bacterium]